MPAQMYLALYRCQDHPNYTAVMIQLGRDGEHGCTRMTPMKCCGSWVMETCWNMSPENMSNMVLEIAGLRAQHEIHNMRHNKETKA